MKQRIAFIGLLLLVLPPVAAGQDRDDQAANVNSRYGVESVSLSGVGDSAISKALRADMQQLVGRNYDQAAVDDLASRLRKELRDYAIDVKVRRGDQAEHVKITFAAERHRNRRFDVHLPPVVYYSGEGWSGAINLNFDTHHNFFSFGLLDTADELLERNAGYRLRYEHRRVGPTRCRLAWSSTRITRPSNRPRKRRSRRRPSFRAPIAGARTSRPRFRCCRSVR